MPKATVEPAVKPVPVTVTSVPPASGPARGDGGDGRDGLVGEQVGGRGGGVPPAVVTVTSTAPAVPAGEVATRVVALVTVTEVAGVAPKATSSRR